MPVDPVDGWTEQVLDARHGRHEVVVIAPAVARSLSETAPRTRLGKWLKRRALHQSWEVRLDRKVVARVDTHAEAVATVEDLRRRLAAVDHE